ncbi:MAG: hypothetical protein JW794_09650 [Candidatus Cloacimonetes bacterium]|nr:hypothetical protein [Candidatus Cloacimonadota bacterium]
MKSKMFFLLLFSAVVLCTCSLEYKYDGPIGLYLPDEAESQEDTIYVDTLNCITFSFCVYETEGQVQVATTEDFSNLLFDSECHDYVYYNVNLVRYIEIPIEKFTIGQTYYCRLRMIATIGFLSVPEWSDWSPVGYFALALSEERNN